MTIKRKTYRMKEQLKVSKALRWVKREASKCSHGHAAVKTEFTLFSHWETGKARYNIDVEVRRTAYLLPIYTKATNDGWVYHAGLLEKLDWEQNN